MDPLGADELAVTRAPRWPLALLVLFIAPLVYLLWRPVGTQIVIHQLESVETAEQQLEALCRMNDWARRGHAAHYSLATLDADGVEFRPTHDGGWDRVAVLIIEWEDGSQTRLQLIGRAGLDCAFHG